MSECCPQCGWPLATHPAVVSERANDTVTRLRPFEYPTAKLRWVWRGARVLQQEWTIHNGQIASGVSEWRDVPEVFDSDPTEYMCPNCVTPWKCNGPHIPQ